MHITKRVKAILAILSAWAAVSSGCVVQAADGKKYNVSDSGCVIATPGPGKQQPQCQ